MDEAKIDSDRVDSAIAALEEAIATASPKDAATYRKAIRLIRDMVIVLNEHGISL